MSASNFLRTFNPFKLISRFKGHYHYTGAVVYPGGIKYYPRRADEPEPTVKPSKLFRVERVRMVRGTPYWEREILRQLKLDQKGIKIAIVKNIPENNARLWKIKHLIRVTPITFPYGEPSASDIKYTTLKENGECIVAKELEVPAERISLHDEFVANPQRISGNTIQKHARLLWMNPWSGGF